MFTRTKPSEEESTPQAQYSSKHKIPENKMPK